MTEWILKEYFEDKISIEILSADLNGSNQKITFNTSKISVLEKGFDFGFEIEQKHLNKILTETLNGNLTYNNLKNSCFLFNVFWLFQLGF